MSGKLVARYYWSDSKVVIYRDDACKLVEFDIEERALWLLPPTSEWTLTNYGRELYFEIKPLGNK